MGFEPTQALTPLPDFQSSLFNLLSTPPKRKTRYFQHLLLIVSGIDFHKLPFLLGYIISRKPITHYFYTAEVELCKLINEDNKTELDIKLFCNVKTVVLIEFSPFSINLYILYTLKYEKSIGIQNIF